MRRVLNGIAGIGKIGNVGRSRYTPALRGLGEGEEVTVTDEVPGGAYSPAVTFGDYGTTEDYYYPGYRDVVNTPGSAGAGTTNYSSGSMLDYVKSFLTFVPQAVAAKTSYDVSQINLDRARRGLPLLTPSQVQQMVPAVTVGVDPNQAAIIKIALVGLGLYGVAKLFQGRKH